MVLRARLLVTLSAVFAVLGLVVASPAHAAVDRQRPQGFSWQLLPTGSTSHFRGLAAVSRQVAWLGGYDGTVLRTVDGGRTWENRSPAGASTLQFRDISATDATHAVAMAAGTGTDSRLYATSDGGRTWQLSYTNTDPAAFFDCMSFSDRQHGLVLSDPVDGRFRILSTRDGGRSWRVLPNAGMPPAQTGEAGFAASGECITTLGRDAWFGSGGGAVSRIYHSRDGGLTWTAQSTPIVSSASAGSSASRSVRRSSASRWAATSTHRRRTPTSRRTPCSVRSGSAPPTSRPAIAPVSRSCRVRSPRSSRSD
ncbi:YCF48-related protein [Allobranchiibius sp. GilTou73]|uniref:WD40/YVTN/BNR-like repeat-containing protein n=1 Tax=Allobranchiibius sp. GilTou73 TaxID=2904523 RepID=UPI001F30FDC4|nr:YCF48-related protein [Allobranchiibius sp. GilTou73]UIJ35304.1 YCF48-related protein [Allobranchiibius sp. GilTou73]